MKNFLSEIKVVRCAGASAAGTSAVAGSNVDRSGYDNFAFVAMLGDVVAGSVLQLKAQHSDTDDGSAMTDITGAATDAVTAGASDCDNKGLGVEAKSTKKYVRPYLTRTTQNAPVEGIWCFLFNGRTLPAAAGDLVARKTVA